MALTNGSFSCNDALLRQVFCFNQRTIMTVQSIRLKFNAAAKLLHPDKVTSQTPRARFLAGRVFAAMSFLKDAHHKRTDPSVITNDPPTVDMFPDYNSIEFAEAASTPYEEVQQEDLTPPDIPRRNGPRADGGPGENESSDEIDGLDGPVHGPQRPASEWISTR